MSDKESYPEFRLPEKWTNGSGGRACISYKGMPGFSLGKENPKTAEMDSLKIGDTVMFEAEYESIGFFKKKEDVWAMTVVTYPNASDAKKRTQDIFTGQQALYYSKCIRKVLRNSYYDDDLIITMSCSIDHLNNNLRENGKVTLFLPEDEYNEIKAYYEVYQKLEECEDSSFYFKFSDNWKYMRKIRFSRRMSWSRGKSKGETNQYLNPKSVTFAGRCKCKGCFKNTTFQNADQIRAAEIADLDLIIEHVNSTLTVSDEKFIIFVPKRYKKYFTERIKISVYDKNSNEYNKFVKDNDEVRIVLETELSYPYQDPPCFWDYSVRPYTFFMLNRTQFYWENWVNVKKYMEEKSRKSKIDEEKRKQLCKRVQYAFIQDGKIVLEVVQRY